MGNSEVGHMTIGSGRVIYQDLVRINNAVSEHTLGDARALKDAFREASRRHSTLHIMGLFSNGGVHSLDAHFYGLVRAAREIGLSDIAVWPFMDGRDTDPKSGSHFIAQLHTFLKKAGCPSCHSAKPRIGGLIGRYFAMDRDKRWDRVKKAYDLLTQNVGTPATDPVAAIEASYAAGITDEFVEPIVMVDDNQTPVAQVKDNDVVIFMNFRNDRAKELTRMLAIEPIPEVNSTPKSVFMCSMTPYDPSFENVHVIFPKETITETLGEVVSREGCAQLRIAETEKYPHVTYFLNGGREALYEGEDRILVNSPKVATYDLQPEMSAPEVADKLVEAIDSEAYPLIVVNFANGDMVGHTGKVDAIKKAVAVIDHEAGRVIEAARAHGYEVIQIADHGNCDHAINEDGSPNTAHSLNPVPMRVISDRVTSAKNGTLADIAPTVLTLMGLPIPEAMTAEVLVTLK